MTQIRPFHALSVLALSLLVFTACGQPASEATQASATVPTTVAEASTPPIASEATAPPTEAEPTTVPTFAIPTLRPTITLPPRSTEPVATTADPTTTVSADETRSAEETTSAEETATTGATSDAATTATADTALAALDPQWSVDSDGNAIPDFLETELGSDPLVDDCAAEQCGDGTLGAEFLLKERNTLLMLDSSGSMAASAGGGGNKLDTAKAALNRYVQVVGNVYNLGFLVYGHKGNNEESGKAESCVGIDVLAPLGQLQPESFEGILGQFQPTGWTPIAASLTRAGETFAGKEDANNRIILVSDGIETCEGDPVAVAQQLHESGLAVTIDVLGYDIADGSADAQQLARIAEVTGGTYYDAKTAADLDEYFRQQGEALGDTYDNMVCEVGNFAQTSICDTSLYNKAQARMRQFEGEAISDDQEAAYREASDRMEAAFAERQQTRRDAQARSEELKEQYFTLRDQIQKALNDTYVGQ